MRKLNTALVGFGLSGSTFHAPILSQLPGFCLSHISSSKKALVQSRYPEACLISNFEDLCGVSKIDLIVITSPHATHYQIAKKALESGRNVIVEKPFVLNLNEGEKLINIAKQNKLFLSVFQNRRWDNGFLTLKKYLKENIFGDIFLYESYFDRYRPNVDHSKWKENDQIDSGIFYDLGVHLIDQSLNLFGMPHEVFADFEKQRSGAKAIDYFNLILKYEKLRVTLGSSSVMTTPRPVHALYGTKGSFVKYGLDPQENDLRASKKFNSENWGEENESYSPTITIENENNFTKTHVKSLKGSYQAYYEAVYQSIVYGKENPVTPESALNNIKIIECAMASAQHKKWVPIV
ncbi:oxidoreductase [Silvanigrella aquatica]|uniref:Oxidoreductase n=1 Tax=Silvanigrella aquatica TaxID=1915309 RepID=A0A1L4CYT3_9BACT|nr:oxidoreductase [Silvanigrella aquatica]APJ03111.1 hypothetical protein AXG55_03985 [Silvanigrella aquatica]